MNGKQGAAMVGALEPGYGSDPNLVTPAVPWALSLSSLQRHAIAVLADIILPGTTDHPAPSQAGIAQFFDEWLSAPYPTQRKDRVLVLLGLQLANDEAQARFGKSFLTAPLGQQTRVVEAMAHGATLERAAEGQTFFRRFRRLVVGGYFTSNAGFRAIGYIGNVPLRTPPTVSADVLSIIDDELRKLAL